MDPNERYDFLFRRRKCCKARLETQPDRMEMQYSWLEPLQHQGWRTKKPHAKNNSTKDYLWDKRGEMDA